jgi:hypothetical protein
VWGGLTYVGLVDAIRIIKLSFPESFLYYNEGSGVFLQETNLWGISVNYPIVPTGLNFISFDDFISDASDVAQSYQKYLYPKVNALHSISYH